MHPTLVGVSSPQQRARSTRVSQLGTHQTRGTHNGDFIFLAMMTRHVCDAAHSLSGGWQSQTGAWHNVGTPWGWYSCRGLRLLPLGARLRAPPRWGAARPGLRPYCRLLAARKRRGAEVEERHPPERPYLLPSFWVLCIPPNHRATHHPPCTLVPPQPGCPRLHRGDQNRSHSRVPGR